MELTDVILPGMDHTGVNVHQKMTNEKGPVNGSDDEEIEDGEIEDGYVGGDVAMNPPNHTTTPTSTDAVKGDMVSK